MGLKPGLICLIVSPYRRIAKFWRWRQKGLARLALRSCDDSKLLGSTAIASAWTQSAGISRHIHNLQGIYNTFNDRYIEISEL
jgi:hypothetical protein